MRILCVKPVLSREKGCDFSFLNVRPKWSKRPRKAIKLTVLTEKITAKWNKQRTLLAIVG